MAIRVLARQRAIKETKRSLQAQGRRSVSQKPKRGIVIVAEAYLATHPELIADARPIVEQWRREDFFGKRVARELERNSQNMSKGEGPTAQGPLLNETHAQN